MSVIQTCKCEECDMQKSFANHWVMLYERNGNLVILPKWDEKMVRRTRHFCGRAHASRYVERWIASSTMGANSDGTGAFDAHKSGHPLAFPQSVLDAEDEAMAAELGRLFRLETPEQSLGLCGRNSELDRLQVDQQLDDFDLLFLLGQGAFARVFLARQRSLGRWVAGA